MDSNSTIALIVAIFSAVATFIQAIAAWNQNRQSVRPYLDAGFSIQEKNGNLVLEVTLKNSGLGPAIVNDFWITEKKTGKKYRDWSIGKLFDKNFESYTYGLFRPNASIECGKNIVIFKIPIAGDISDIQKFLGDNFAIGIIYESFQGERFEYHSKDHEWPLAYKWEIEDNSR